MTADPEAPTRADVWAEVVVGLVVISALALFGGWSWWFYDTSLRPLARVVPTMTATPDIDPKVANELARRQRLVSDLLASGHFERSRGRLDLAAQAYRQALAIDPDSYDVRQSLRDIGIEPPPSANERTPTPVPPTPGPTVTVRP